MKISLLVQKLKGGKERERETDRHTHTHTHTEREREHERGKRHQLFITSRKLTILL
jgi:hypothetical protein